MFKNIEIHNSQAKDIDTIAKLYNEATDYQIKKSAVPWPVIERQLIEREITEKRQWKILINNKVACVFSISYSDPQIWLELNEAPAIYIHRISTSPEFRGHYLVKEIIKWSINFAKANNKKYIRMDTVGENLALINYYKKCGFDFLGLSKLKDTLDLPSHYHKSTVCLFQIKIK